MEGKYLRSKEVKEKYGIAPAHCHRDLVEKGNCRTKKYIFCGKECTSYYEPDVKKIVAAKNARKRVAMNRYKIRPDVMHGTKSRLRKVLPNKMYKKLRNAWFGMMRRCYTDERPDWAHYREFGITVCDEWLHSFDDFALWAIDNGVDYHLSLDRIDNDRGYSPDNCRWATKFQQGNNTSVNKILIYKGEEKTVAEWAEEYNIPYSRLWARISQGWSVEEALTSPLRYGKTINSLRMTFNGETKALSDWAREEGLPYYLVLNRFKKGWPPEKVLSRDDFRGKR